jgi:hypothetical protein
MVEMGLVHDFSFVIMHSTFDFAYGASWTWGLNFF